MNNEIDQKLDDILNIGSDIKKETQVVKLPSRHENMETDYRYARENLYDLVERGQDAIDGILQLSKETEHPRAYEVAGQLIKNVSEVTERLVELQEKMKKLKAVPDTGPKSVTNALFVGSTKELQKMLKSNG
jgi:hypothetical protein